MRDGMETNHESQIEVCSNEQSTKDANVEEFQSHAATRTSVDAAPIMILTSYFHH